MSSWCHWHRRERPERQLTNTGSQRFSWLPGCGWALRFQLPARQTLTHPPARLSTDLNPGWCHRAEKDYGCFYQTHALEKSPQEWSQNWKCGGEILFLLVHEVLGQSCFAVPKSPPAYLSRACRRHSRGLRPLWCTPSQCATAGVAQTVVWNSLCRGTWGHGENSASVNTQAWCLNLSNLPLLFSRPCTMQGSTFAAWK